MSNAMQIGAIVAELFHADRWRGIWRDGRTDMTKLIVALCNFANAPKSYKDSQVCLQNKASCFSETFDNCVLSNDLKEECACALKENVRGLFLS
jgi:hypothetical protein